MTDIIKRLQNTALDKDNFPRMDCEKWLPVGLAREAADEIERLRHDVERYMQIANDAINAGEDAIQAERDERRRTFGPFPWEVGAPETKK